MSFLGTIEDTRAEIQVDGLLGAARVLAANVGGDLDLMRFVETGELPLPPLDVRGEIRGASLESLPVACRYVAGPLDGDFEAHLFGEEPSMRLNLDANGIRARSMAEGIQGSGLYVRATPPAEVHLVVEATESRASATLIGDWWNGGTTQIEATIPVAWTGEPALPEIADDAEIDGTARFEYTPLGAPLAWLSDTAGVEGILEGEVAVSGTLSDPRVHGSLALADGRVELRSIGQRLRDVHGSIVFDGDEIDLRNIHARDGNGEATVSGQIVLESFAPRYLRNVRLEADDFPVRQEGSVMAQLDGAASLDGCFCSERLACPIDGEAQTCTSPSFLGTLRVARLDVQLPDDGSRSSMGLAEHPDVYVVGEDGPPVAEEEIPFVWHLAIDATNRFWVRSAEQDFAAQVSAELEVSLAGDDFKIRGEARIHRGNFSVFGKAFSVESASMLFRNTETIDPVVSLVAVHELRNRPGESVRVEVSGTLSHPEVRFTTTIDGVSDQGEIIALLLTGDTRIDRALQSERSNPQGAAAEATDFLAGVAFGVATLALREQFGEIIPTIRIEMGNDGFRSPIIRAGINVDSIIPEAMRDVVRGIYIEGYFTARRADGTEDSTRQSHDTGFLIELQFPRNIVGTSDYAPPNNWSLDITWEP